MAATRQASAGADIFPEGLHIAPSEQGTTTTLEFEGEWGLAERDGARAAVEQALKRRPECMVLDLSLVSFIDSSGIHAAVTAAKRCAAWNVRLVIIPGPPHVHRMFEICQVTALLPFATQA